MSLLDLMTGHWAILPEKLAELQEIYATHMRGEKIDIEAVQARLGRQLANEQKTYTVEPGGVAVLHAQGVMSPKANLFMQVSGGISTQMLARQMDSMAADPRAKSAVVVWDSPGGNVLGVPVAAQAMRNLAAAKPTVSLVDNTMASAAAWVGTGANAIYITGATDQVGSLGVIGRLSWGKASPNSMEFIRGKYKAAAVNGQAPSAEYIAYYEAQLDHLYTLLIDAVAENRGVSAEQVLQNMADGRVFIGQQAIDAGFVDGVSTLEPLVEQLATNPGAFAARRKAVFAPGAPASPQSTGAGAALSDDHTTEGNVMPQADTNAVTRESFERDHPALFAALRSEFMAAGAAAETLRVKAVLEQGQGFAAHAELVHKLALDGKTTPPEAAQAILAAERAATAAAAAAHAKDAPKAAADAAAPEGKGAEELTKAQQAEKAHAYATEHGISFVAALKKLGFAS